MSTPHFDPHTPHSSPHREDTPRLTTYAWLSIVAAFLTISLKAVAFLLTGSVGLLSDAAESMVNLVAALIALVALKQLSKPADSRYTYGRSKVEYFSAAVEGAMIFGAAAFITFAASVRLVHHSPLTNLDAGLLISVFASLVNAVVGMTLIRAGRRFRSPTLTADGTHLMTDVVTSIGVLVGIGLVWLTNWDILDPIVALLVSLNIVIAGIRLIRTALSGLMDITLPEDENRALVSVLTAHTTADVSFHGLQTRRSGRDSFANVDMLVPGSWSVREGHEQAENVIAQMCAALPGLRVIIHVEPIEDPRSYDDIPDGFVPLN